MLSFIYRCSLKPDMYIYLAEEDVFDNVPREIFNSLGIVEFSMELDIQADTKLAREDTCKRRYWNRSRQPQGVWFSSTTGRSRVG